MQYVEKCSPQEELDLSALDGINFDDIDLDGVVRHIHIPVDASCGDASCGCGWEFRTTLLVPVTTTRDRAGLPTEAVNLPELSEALLQLRGFLEERHRNATFGKCDGSVNVYTKHEPHPARLQAVA